MKWSSFHPLWRCENPQRKAQTSHEPIDANCTCYAGKGSADAQGNISGGLFRVYLDHLDRCGKMLGPMLATIHNLRSYLNLMSEMREALDAGRFGEFKKQFCEDRARGV